MTTPPSADRPAAADGRVPLASSTERDRDPDGLPLTEKDLRAWYRASAPATLRQRITELARDEQSHRLAQSTTSPEPIDRPSTPSLIEQEPRMSTASLGPDPMLATPATRPGSWPRSERPFQDRESPDSWARRRPSPPRRPYGVIATLVLVLLVASAVALRLSAPGGEDQPTSLAGAVAATATSDPATRPAPTAPLGAASDQAAPVYGTAPDGTNYLRVPYADCDSVSPRGFDEVMGIVVGEDYPFDSYPPAIEIALVRGDTGGYTFGAIPGGTSPPQEAIDAAVHAFAVYVGCGDMALHQASAMTAEGLARQAYAVPNAQPWDGEVSGSYLRSLWQDGQGLTAPDEDHLGELAPVYLYEFRLLEDGRLLAFMSVARGGYTSDELPAFNINMGYVLFAERDGQWLIDEQLAGAQ